MDALGNHLFVRPLQTDDEFTRIHYARFDYKNGWLGVRIEPEDQNRADAIKGSIPQEERFYRGDTRTWVVKPKWGPTLASILELHCQGFGLKFAEGQEDLIRSLLFGFDPAGRDETAAAGPKFVNVGIIGEPNTSHNTPTVPAMLPGLDTRSEAQRDLDNRYIKYLSRWNSNITDRDHAKGLRMSAREWVGRMVRSEPRPSDFKPEGSANADRAWDEAIRRCNGVEI